MGHPIPNLRRKSKHVSQNYIKQSHQDLAGNRKPNGSSNPKFKKEVKTCVTELYKTKPDMSDSDFTSNETDEFTE